VTPPSGAPAPIGALPAGFVLEGDATRGWCAVREDLTGAFASSGFGLDADGATRTTELGGRDALSELVLDEDAPSALLRRHRRGGLAARLGFERFADPARPFDELRLSESLRDDGVRTPRILAARAKRVGSRFELALVVERVDRARDLFAALTLARPHERHELVRAAARFVAELFDAGLDHRDLHPKNLLVEPGESPDDPPRLWVLDLDRCARRQPLPEARRAAALARCLRWCLRRRVELAFTRTDALRFLRAHLPAGAAWRPTWRVLQRSAERRLKVRLGR